MKREKRVYSGKRKTVIFAFLFTTLLFVCFGCASGTTPTAFFTYTPRYPGVNQPITFDASLCYDPEGCITNYEWDFGDGNTTNTTEKIITHSYALEGDYSVNLTVTDSDGAKKSTSKEVTVLMSPSPEEEWSKTFGGPNDDMSNSVQQTADGGYILAGVTWSGGTAPTDVWLMKTDSNGKVLWTKTFGGTARDKARSLQQTIDGGYIFAGSTVSYAPGDYDVWLVKTNSNGSEQWNKTFGDTDISSAAGAVQQTADGGYVLAGGMGSYATGNCDVLLIKTDSNGNEEWNKTFGGTSRDFAYCINQTTDGGYILAGETYSYGAGQSDFWLVKTNSNGSEQWNKTFGGTAFDRAYSVQQTTDSGYILAGGMGAYALGICDIWLIKTDSSGNEQWNKTFGDTDIDSAAEAVQQTTDGGYILVGGTGSIVPGGGGGIPAELSGNDCDVWLVKTDSNGNEEWIKTFSGTSRDYAHCVQQTTDGGYILAGGTRSYASDDYDDYDVWLIKVKGEPAEPTGELTEQPVPIPGFKISGLLLGLILSVALATLKKMKNR